MSDPDQVCKPEIGARVAGWFWSKARGKRDRGDGTFEWRTLNELADLDDIHAITRTVNGGLINLDKRIFYVDAAKRVLGAS